MQINSAQNAAARRAERMKQSRAKRFDLAIIGGGIHGASLCRQAAAAGLTTVLLEAKDYGFGISSRSSKMLHGGVRYLEQGNIALVREALAERAYLLAQAPHLTRTQAFLLPILPQSGRPKWQMQIGLWMYDLLSRLFRPKEVSSFADRFRPHSSLGPDSRQWRQLSELGLPLQAMLRYYDGQMDDTRIVIEKVIDAESLGALTLNFAQVKRIEREAAHWRLQWDDGFAGGSSTVEATFIANMAGPWVPEVHELYEPWPERWPQPLYSRGVHLLFDIVWPTSGLILPTDERGRYYFIWPYFSPAGRGALVGPTSKAVSRNEWDPQPEPEEVAELMRYLQRDFPKAGFSEDRLLSSFCGMRILAGPEGGSKSAGVNKVSREDKLLRKEGYVALLGGKYTTSRKTAETILSGILKGLGGSPAPDIALRPLPGGKDWGMPTKRKLLQLLRERLAQGQATAEEKRTFAVQLRAALRRFGSQAELLLQPPYAGEGPLDVEGLLRAEIRYLVDKEQGLDENGILSRLGWDDFPRLAEQFAEIIDSEISQLLKK